MRKQITLYTFSIFQILFFLTPAYPALSETEVNNSSRDVFNIHIEDLALSDALQYLSEVSGKKIILLGSYQPERRSTLHMENTNVDLTINKLLNGFDYVKFNQDSERIIFLVGDINGDTEKLPPVSDSDSISVTTKHGKILKSPDGIEEFLPISSIPNEITDNREYIYLNTSGVPEAIPVSRKHELTDNREYIYLNTSGVPEAIPVSRGHELTDNREYIYLNTSGVPEAIPVSRGYELTVSREYIYLNTSGVPEAIPVSRGHDISDKKHN